MASFAHALRSFSSGSLSRDQLISEVERILTDGRSDENWMLETLAEEHTRVPLPAEVHAAVKRRIEESAKKKQESAETRAAVGSDFIDPDGGATQFFGDSPQAQPPAGEKRTSSQHGNLYDAGTPQGVEKIKGVGDVLNDRFVLEERVGSGGMGTVYRALDRRKLEAHDRNPYVAVKVLNVEFRAHPLSLIALQREAKKSQSLAHPNIVRVYDFDRDGATVYMTMEYLSGKSLADLFRARDFKGMRLEEAMPILEQIAAALKFAHDSGIVHADFKPANVIITDRGQVKVIDFGIARAFQRPDQIDMEATRFNPGSLGALTPTYASPEILEHQELGPRDDIYALGCIAYEMLTGRHPFGRMQATEARDGGLQLERRKGLTRRQWKALKRALAFDREQRTPTVEQFCHDIRCDGIFSPSVFKLSALAASVLAVVAVAGYFYSMPQAPVVKSPAVDVPELSVSAVMPVLDKVSCAALDASVKDGIVKVRGYVSERFGVKALESALLALPGAKKVATQVTPVSDEKCAVLDLYAPYWRANNAAGEGTTVRTQNEHGDFREGDPLVVKITTPPYESYVSLDYYSLDGGVLHMVPGPRIKANEAPPNYTATIGDLGEWIIAKPFGTEMVAVLNTPKPLFDRPREEAETGAAYLAALRKRLEQLGKESGRDKITADFVLIKTKPRSLEGPGDKTVRQP
jgi:predicted Ser/Thr protein kinase